MTLPVGAVKEEDTITNEPFFTLELLVLIVSILCAGVIIAQLEVWILSWLFSIIDYFLDPCNTYINPASVRCQDDYYSYR